MKRNCPYSLIIVVLMLSIAAAIGKGLGVDRKDILPQDRQLTSFNKQQTESGQAGHCFVAPESILNHLLHRISSTRGGGTPAVKVFNHNPFYRLNLFFTQITSHRLIRIESLFMAHYSRKAKNGYYIYVLRKLLI